MAAIGTIRGVIRALAATFLLCTCLASPASAAKTVWAVGDGADSGTKDDALAAMIAGRDPDAFLYLGDVYESGTAGEFASFYDTGYGRLKSITYPTPGNHEWDHRVDGYNPYWGSRFTSPHYYSFDLGGWHFISLNSEENHGEGSAQLSWLRRDLSERSGNCTIAFWHRARYSAGTNHGDDDGLVQVWGSLVGRASIVLTAHDHSYQRFKPIDAITNWVVGSGGHGLTGVNGGDSRLVAHNNTDYGALRLSLTSGHADFAFIDSAGAVHDSGAVTCTPGASRGRPDTRRPRVTRVSMSRKRIRGSAKSSRRLVFSYLLSERASVDITIKRVSKRGTVSLRRLSQAGRKGRNRKRYSGTHDGRPLRPGLYRAVVEATDLTGNASVPKTVSFRVLRPR
jgi:hypothetical protein